MAGEASECKTSALFDEYKTLLDATGASLSLPTQEIGPNDVLLAVDVQNDFLPEADAPSGGRFGVADGATAARHTADLIRHFGARGALVLATRDYHPKGHCSFNTAGGPFPPHCVQGGEGSKFFAPVAEALTAGRKAGHRVHVVYKGFCEDVDSFGAFPYPDYHAKERLSHTEGKLDCSLAWTGGFILKASSLEEDINAPPDVMAVLNRIPLKELIEKECPVSEDKPRRLFVAGLAFDFCVLDTALTAASDGFGDIRIVYEASRAAHIPGVGTFGTGFLTDPASIVKKLDDAGIKLMGLSEVK